MNNMKIFRFCCLLLAAGICLSANVARAERTWKIPEDFQWGVTFGFYATNGYFSSSVAKDEIEAIARTGATWVTVVPTVCADRQEISWVPQGGIYLQGGETLRCPWQK